MIIVCRLPPKTDAMIKIALNILLILNALASGVDLTRLVQLEVDELSFELHGCI
jgi:hypothetical protein